MLYKSLILLLCISLTYAVTNTIDVTVVSTAPHSQSVNPSFTSFSIEWFAVYQFMSSAKSNVSLNQPVINMLSTLYNHSGGTPVFRIGGDSSEEYYNNSQYAYNWITDTHLYVIKEFAAKTKGSVVYGLNFVDGTNPAAAILLLQAIQRVSNWANLKAFEIGNEIDIFPSQNPPLRTGTWNITIYQQQWEYYVSQITTPSISKLNLPTKRIFQGSTACCADNWMPEMPAYFKAEQALCPSYSIHWYPEDECGSDVATLTYLLSDTVRTRTINRHGPLAAAANAVGSQYWIGESNSVACSGVANVSMVQGSAVWALDYMFDMALLNVSGINFHQFGGYSSFSSNSTATIAPVVYPLFYAYWFFQQTIGKNSVMLTPNFTTSNILVRGHVLKDLVSDSVKVVIAHKDSSSTAVAAAVTVNITDYVSAKLSSSASLMVLSAPSCTSETGLSLSGQTWDNSRDGFPLGTQKLGSVTGKNGVFTFTVQPCTVAMLQVPTTA